jgi:hypothetical protein
MALTKVSGHLQNGATINAADFGVSASASATTNTTALQSALDTLVNGGTLVISEDISINGEVQVKYDNITITGDSRPTITQSVAGLRVFWGTDVKSITIKSIKINGTSSSVAYNGVALDGDGEGAIHFTKGAANISNIRIYDCEIYNAFTPISITYCGNVWVQNNLIRNYYKFGILVSRSYNFHIDDNNIYTCEYEVAGNNAYGIMGTGDASASGDIQQRCSISNNVIDYVRLWDGIMSHDVDDIIITGNHITNVRIGIDISYSASITSDIQNVIISDNYIELTTTDIWAGAPANHSGIHLIGDNGTPTFIERGIISNNIIKDYNKMTGYTPSGDVVSAIRVATVKNVSVLGNIISDMGDATTAVSPIGVFYPKENVEISNNQITYNLNQSAILVYAADTNTHQNLSVQNNSVFNQNATGVSSVNLLSLNVAGSGGGATCTYSGVVYSGNTSNLDKKTVQVGTGVTVNYSVSANLFSSAIGMADGITAPSTLTGIAQLYVDTSDGDLKIKFGDGTVKTIVVDT